METATRDRRSELLLWLSAWLSAWGLPSPEELVRRARLDPEPLNEALRAFGQALWREGAPYYRYAETVNACAMLDSTVKRALSGAWDLAYCWLEEEPGRHHLPMPLAVVGALACLALLQGWPRVGALLLLGWAGLLRPGEFLTARRAQLVLPRDVLFTVQFALLAIPVPKTRRTAAKHQTSRVDPADIVELLDAVFSPLLPSESLWPASDSTFRARFAALARRLGLPVDRSRAYPRFEPGEVLDLGSLRTGGATCLWQLSENAPLVQQRGRWLNVRNMNIYLQELASTTLLSRLPEGVRAAVAELSGACPWVLEHACGMARAGLPPGRWRSEWARLIRKRGSSG